MSSYDASITPTNADELVAWVAQTLRGDSELEGLLRGAGRVYEQRRPTGDEESSAIVRLRMPAGGRVQPFSGLGGPRVQVVFYTWPDEPDVDKWHRATQTRAYELLTGKSPMLSSSRVVQPLRRVMRPGPPRFDEEVQQYYTTGTYHASLAPIT